MLAGYYGERHIYKRKRHNTTYLEVLNGSDIFTWSCSWTNCSLMLFDSDRIYCRSLEPLFIPCSIVLDKEMLKKQKRQIRGEIWCLCKLLHCWSDHDCSSRKLFACHEVMSRNRLRQTCSSTSICTWKKQRIWYCRKSKALRRWYGAYGRYTWALRSWQSFFLLNKSGGQEYHAQFYPRVFQRRTLSQIAGWLVHSCWGWRLCKIASSI